MQTDFACDRLLKNILTAITSEVASILSGNLFECTFFSQNKNILTFLFDFIFIVFLVNYFS
jgi:hypothetical protein